MVTEAAMKRPAKLRGKIRREIIRNFVITKIGEIESYIMEDFISDFRFTDNTFCQVNSRKNPPTK